MSSHDVTAIIPLRNASKYIDQTLGSLATQTVPVDHVIVVDDASEDDSYERVQNWVPILPIRTIRSAQPMGTWKARDTAISESTTDLILQVDADDIVTPDHVAVMLETYQQTPGLVAPTHRNLKVEANGHLIPVPSSYRPTPLHEQLARILVINFVATPGTLYCKEDYRTVGGYRRYDYGDDWDLWIRFAAAGIPITKPANPTYIYRTHPTNKSSKANRRITDLEVLERFLREFPEPSHQRIARLSMLQRLGIAYLSNLEDADKEVETSEPISRSLFKQVFRSCRDPKIGIITHGISRADDSEEVVVVSTHGKLMIRAEILGPGGPLEVSEVGPGVPELTDWPQIGGWLQRFSLEGVEVPRLDLS